MEASAEQGGGLWEPILQELRIWKRAWEHREEEALIGLAACVLLLVLLGFLSLLRMTTPHPQQATSRPGSNPLPYSMAWTAAILLPACLYFMSTPQGVYLVDSGSFSLAAFLPGIAHPPGFPAFVHLAHSWLQIPLELDVAYKLNLFSTFFGSVSVFLVWNISRMWIQAGYQGRLKVFHPWTMEVPPLLGASLAMFSWPFWMYSTITEVYTLTSACLLLTLYFVSLWAERCHQFSKANLVLLILAGASFGIAGSAHHVAAALALPGFCYMVFAHQPRSSPLNIGVCGISALIMGFYFYIVFMFQLAQTDPLWSWGGPKTLSRLWAHVVGRQYSVNLFGNLNWKSFRVEAIRVVWITIYSYSPIGSYVGLCALLQTYLNDTTSKQQQNSLRIKKHTLLLFLVFSLFFVFVYIISEDKEGYFMTMTWSLGISFALGSHELLSSKYCRSASLGFRELILILLLLSGPLLCGYQNFHHGGCYRPDDIRAETVVEVMMKPLPPGSLVVLKDFQVYSPWLYLHHVKGHRPDLIVVDALLVMRSWYLDYLRIHAAPLYQSSRVLRKEMKYRKLLAAFEEQRPHDGNKIQKAYLDYINSLIDETKLLGKEVYNVPQLGSFDPNIGPGYSWIPFGLAYIGR